MSHSADTNRRLILFTRFPEPGQTKTRLIPALGPKGAADLQRRLTEGTLSEAQRLARRMPLSVEVRCAGASRERMQQWLGREPLYRRQEGDGLGERMHTALGDALGEGARGAVLVGSDIPGISANVLSRAFETLTRRDVVLGPARDGGYYLVGLRRPAPGLFRGIYWGTDDVLRQTLRAVRRLGLSHALLDELDDMDTPEDLERWDAAAWGPLHTPDSPRISVIVPTLNEEAGIGAALDSAKPGRNFEAIVVDGGSVDRTRDIARQKGATVIEGPRHRARQLNLGADAAEGGLLLFLHGDTLLPPGYDVHVRRALGRPEVALAAFELAISGDEPRLRSVEAAVRYRSRRWKTPYGDQSLFARAETFRRLGGFPDMPIMEDYAFVRRARRCGHVVTLPARALTSGRRWRRLGVLRTTLVNYGMVLAYHLGVPVETLARWYRGQSGSRG